MIEQVYRTQSKKISLSFGNYQIDISNSLNDQIEVTTTETDGYADIENTVIIPAEMIDALILALQDIR